MKYFDKSKLIIREHVGDVEKNEDGVESLTRTVNSAPIIEFEDGSKVVFDWHWLIKQAIKYKEEIDNE